MKTHLITFATDDFYDSANYLRYTCFTNDKVIDHFKLYQVKDILDFKNENQSIFNYPKGFGCYSWQPYITLKHLESMEDGDVLIYCDAAAEIKKSLKPLIDKALKYKSAFFYVGGLYCQKNWTKRDTFILMDCDTSEYHNLHQCMGGLQIYVKNKENIEFLKEFVKHATTNRIIGDLKSFNPNLEGFREHRHNQSILTIMAHKYNRKKFRDPTAYGLNDNIKDSPYGELINFHRQRIKMDKITVITPTIGENGLKECIDSVQNQTYINVEHYIVIDGPEFTAKVNKILENMPTKKPIHVLQLPYNVGKNGWNGHRVYGSLPFLIQGEYVSFLDQDNTIDPNHLQSLYNVLKSGEYDWTFSFRKLYCDGKYVDEDNCESLGNIHPVGENNKLYHIDTSCYLLKREVALYAGPSWNVQWTGDRTFYDCVKKRYPDYGCSYLYSLNYNIPQDRSQMRKNCPYNNTFFYFKQQNALMSNKYNNKLPWKNDYKPKLYIFHFDPKHTQQVIHINYPSSKSYFYKDWCLSLLQVLKEKYHLINGYDNPSEIPPKSTILVTMCLPQMLPFDVLERTDITKIIYTYEGPNVRHQQQWNIQFLKNFSDYVFTYWEPLLKEDFTRYVPQMIGFDIKNINDTNLLTINNSYEKNICIILSRRSFTREPYYINNIKMESLDHLREYYARGLKNVTCYGKGWDPKVDKIGQQPNESKEDGSHRGHWDIEIRKQYTFNLIIENCNGDGYVSEKIYDAFVSGCIPLYYGNINKRHNIPDDCYIDVKKYPKVEDLQTYLDSLTSHQLKEMKYNIYMHRKKMLNDASGYQLLNALNEFL